MLRIFYFAVCLINLVISVKSQVIYTIAAPGMIRPYLNYSVAVSVHEAEELCKIEIGISNSKYKMSKIIEVQPRSTEIVEFNVENLRWDEYALTIKGISGITVENSTDLSFEDNQPWAIVQTNKPIYKPGDLIQFRALFLDGRTHPEAFHRPVTISLLTPDYNTIQEWKDLNLTQGVFMGEFRLAEKPFYGRWILDISSDEQSQIASHKFKVARYELPRFEVNIDTVHDVALADEVIKITVISKYTFGKPVKGTATIFISDEKSHTKKIIASDGKVHVEFNIANEVPNTDLSALDLATKEYDITASFEEELTGYIQNSTVTIVLHNNDANIEAINIPCNHYIGMPTIFIVAIKKNDGTPVQDKTNLVELELEVFRGYSLLKLYSLIDSNGLATFNITTGIPYGHFPISVQYLDKSKDFGSIFSQEMEEKDETPRLIHLNLKTKSPQLRKNVSIEVNWDEPINYFVYTVVGRGNIIKAQHVNVTMDMKSYTIEFSSTLQMVPNTAVFVHYIYDNNLRFEEQTIEFERDFQNTLEISTNLEASPGDNVEFNITTDPNSFVGLLGIDQRLSQLGGSGNDINRDDIFQKLIWFDTQTPIRGKGRYPGKVSGLVTLTNANHPFRSPKRYYIGGGPEPVPEAPGKVISVRSRFPETWIFDHFEMTNGTSFNFKKQIPDTITSWIITGFSMNSKTGLALTKTPTKIQINKPFFISIDVPYSVKQGEVISIKVLVFNYLNKTLETDVIMDNTDSDYEFTEATNDVDEHAVDVPKQTKHISMPPQSARSVSFLIKPKNIGITTLKVTAVNSLAGDTVHQKLKVEPEGATQYQNHAFFINLNDKSREHKETVTIDVPANAVPHSEHLELSTVADFVGLTIKNIDKLLGSLPNGNGEQNLVKLVPSIFVLKYLKTTHQNMPNLTKKALETLTIGYQLEIGFKHDDGSFSAYGQSDNSEIIGSTLLTAYVARFFHQVSEFVHVRPYFVNDAFEFLASKQMTGGNFAEFGVLMEFSHLNDARLTAFVLLAFLENEYATKAYHSNIQKGIQYLLQNLDENTEDIYTQSITAFILKLSKHPLADEAINKLKALAKQENGYTWWSSKPRKQKRQSRARSSGSDIEITSYVLLAMLEGAEFATEYVLPIVKWLVKQRNSNGGFSSTQDTIAGLQALIRFAEITGIGRSGTMDIEFVCEGVGVENKETLEIMPDNSMLLMTHVLPEATRKVTITAKGSGSSLVQLSYNYNTIDMKAQSSLRLHASVKENTLPKQLIIDICAEYVPTDIDSNKTNMLIIEASLPSGFTANKYKLDKLRDFRTILFTETKKLDTIAIVYLQGLEINQSKCISIEATRTYEVAKQKATPIVIYDSINKDLKSTGFYKYQTSLCDICEGNECKLDCEKRKVSDDATAFNITQPEMKLLTSASSIKLQASA